MDEWERRQKLEEALRDAVQARGATPAEQRTARHGRPRRSPAVAAVILVLGWACIGWIWLARPEFVFGPAEPPPPSVEEREASLRFAMFLEYRRVEAFRARRGRLPAALADAGPVEEGVSYQRDGSGFTLVGQRGGITLRLTDAMDPDSFLGRSLEVIER